MTKTPLQKAIEAEPFCGSQRAFALALGTSQQNINNWVRKGRAIPIELVPRAAEISGIAAHEWRPDLPHLFPPVAA